MTATMNGAPRQRKQLSDQLDRLDSIIDALADGLPGAVADAARDGTRQAVKDAVVEILTNPDLRSLFQGVAPPTPSVAPAVSERPGPWGRLKARLAAARRAVVGPCRAAVGVVVGHVRAVGGRVAAVARGANALLPLVRVAAVGAIVGTAAGAVSYACPHAVSATLTGVGGLVAAVAAQAGAKAFKAARTFGLV